MSTFEHLWAGIDYDIVKLGELDKEATALEEQSFRAIFMPKWM